MSSTPEVQTIIDAAQALDAKLAAQQQQYAGLQASDADLAAKYNLDESQIAQLRLELTSAQLPTIFQPTIITGIERNPARGANGWNFATDHTVTAQAPHSNGTITPAADGWTDFEITPAMPYDNTYFYFQLGPQPQATRFGWQATVSIADSEIPKCQAWEWEFEQTINGRFFNMGWQCLFAKSDGGPAWRYFDKVNHHWIKTPIPLDLGMFSGGKPVTVISEHHKPDPDHIQFDSLVVNGTRYPLANVINPPEDQHKPTVNFLHYSFQQDPMKSQGWTIRVKDMRAMYL